MNKKIVTITGAAGNIAYSLIFRILSNNVFDEKTKIQKRRKVATKTNKENRQET